MKGQGKSTLAIYLGRRVQKVIGAHTILIFDPKRTFNSIPHTSDLSQFEAWMTEGGHDAIAYQPPRVSGDEKNSDVVWEEFSRFIDALGIEYHLGERQSPSRANLRPVILIVDEAWYLQEGKTVHPKLEEIVRLHDNRNFWLIQAAHRPKDFSTRIRWQIDELYMFQQWQAEQIVVIEEWCGPEVASLVESLPKHHVMRFDVANRKWEAWREPSGWYTNLNEGENDGRNNEAATGEQSATDGDGT